jgi:hypothetical protein
MRRQTQGVHDEIGIPPAAREVVHELQDADLEKGGSSDLPMAALDTEARQQRNRGTLGKHRADVDVTFAVERTQVRPHHSKCRDDGAGAVDRDQVRGDVIQIVDSGIAQIAFEDLAPERERRRPLGCVGDFEGQALEANALPARFH